MTANRASQKAFISFACSALTVAFAFPALATLNVDGVHGEKIVWLNAPGNTPPEACWIPQHFQGAKYSSGDLADESALCKINIYENTAACPKLNSTNPGLDLYSVPKGSTASQVAAQACKVEGAKKIAKYKLSTSCSYAPSIIGYYHMSRILGGVANVPTTVLRTLDLDTHIQIGHTALARAPKNDIIYQTWSGLVSQLTRGEQAPKRDLLLTSNFEQSYGALLKIEKGDDFYKEFFNGGGDNVTRTQNLRDKNPIIAALANSAGVERLVSREFTAANVQKMVQLKDASDMIVLDSLMNQQDRMGNIHYLVKYYYLDDADKNSDGSPKLKVSKKLTDEQINSLGAVKVKEMLLKDNDCGVAKDNIDNKVGLIGRVAHMNPNTYRSLQRLNAVADKAEIKAFFQQNMAFTANDFASVRKNLRDVATKLRAACDAGRLKLDLDVQSFFAGGAVPSQSCDI